MTQAAPIRPFRFDSAIPRTIEWVSEPLDPDAPSTFQITKQHILEHTVTQSEFLDPAGGNPSHQTTFRKFTGYKLDSCRVLINKPDFSKSGIGKAEVTLEGLRSMDRTTYLEVFGNSENASKIFWHNSAQYRDAEIFKPVQAGGSLESIVLTVVAVNCTVTIRFHGSFVPRPFPSVQFQTPVPAGVGFTGITDLITAIASAAGKSAIMHLSSAILPAALVESVAESNEDAKQHLCLRMSGFGQDSCEAAGDCCCNTCVGL